MSPRHHSTRALLTVTNGSPFHFVGLICCAEVLSPICAPGAAYFSTFLWVYKGGLNAFGVVMAAKTWNCADGVGEVRRVSR